jgi:tetratricopeptide (TPR) repeat protein
MAEPQGEHVVATYRFKIGGKTLSLDFSHAFALGDALFEAGRLETARSVFHVLAKITDRGPRARIMLAQCEAGLRHFDACSEILTAAFKGEDKPIAEELHTAFVFHKLGLRDDAIRAVSKLAMKFESTPTLCLVLGDLFAEAGNLKKARACWKLAIKRDLLRGGVELAARRRLKSQRGTRSANQGPPDKKKT